MICINDEESNVLSFQKMDWKHSHIEDYMYSREKGVKTISITEKTNWN